MSLAAFVGVRRTKPGERRENRRREHALIPVRPLRKETKVKVTHAASGLALLVVSSDLPEVLALAHRIVVMSEGRVAGELDAASATEVGILELAAINVNKSDQKGAAA